MALRNMALGLPTPLACATMGKPAKAWRGASIFVQIAAHQQRRLGSGGQALDGFVVAVAGGRQAQTRRPSRPDRCTFPHPPPGPHPPGRRRLPGSRRARPRRLKLQRLLHVSASMPFSPAKSAIRHPSGPGGRAVAPAYCRRTAPAAEPAGIVHGASMAMKASSRSEISQCSPTGVWPIPAMTTSVIFLTLFRWSAYARIYFIAILPR